MGNVLAFIPKAIKLLGTVAQVANMLAAAFGAIHAHHAGTAPATTLPASE
jgi:hypothetical protein